MLSKDKASLLHVISDSFKTEVTDPRGCRKILIIDGMVAVNQINKGVGFKT